MRNYAKNLNLTELDILNITASLETFKDLRKKELEKANDYESRQLLKEVINDVENTISKFDEAMTDILDENRDKLSNEIKGQIVDLIINDFFFGTKEFGMSDLIESMPIDSVKMRLKEFGLTKSDFKKMSDKELKAKLAELEMHDVLNFKEDK